MKSDLLYNNAHRISSYHSCINLSNLGTYLIPITQYLSSLRSNIFILSSPVEVNNIPMGLHYTHSPPTG